MRRRQKSLFHIKGRVIFVLLMVLTIVLSTGIALAQQGKSPGNSDATQSCLTCHQSVTPGIYADWKAGRHANVTPSGGLSRSELERRISARNVPDSLANITVGCAECHTLRADEHPDSFDHNGFKVHSVVSSADCAVCHPDEKAQYSMNLMSFARENLTKNDLYQLLITSINGGIQWIDNSLRQTEADSSTNEQSCFFCHGTEIKVGEMEQRETEFGPMSFPRLSGWPNQGVGRIHPDGSLGACTPCHARHRFSIEVARKPYTCSECHKGPDVPAFKVYDVSKHGNIYASLHHEFEFDTVPWTIGEDFTAPTCAVCHMSLIQNKDEEVVVRRTHQINDRLYTRLFGLIYAHPHPRSPRTYQVKNSMGLQLPTELNGDFVSDVLIGTKEQKNRKETMQQVCLNCHGYQWVTNQFDLLDSIVESTNDQTKAATELIQQAWNNGLADGPSAGANPFDEGLERLWVQQWLFYANSVRLSAAMAGADYGVFANGRWYLTRNIHDMYDRMRLLEAAE